MPADPASSTILRPGPRLTAAWVLSGVLLLLMVVQAALGLADRLGFDRARLADRAVVTPACGLAGASPRWARTATGTTVELARAFVDPPASW